MWYLKQTTFAQFRVTGVNAKLALYLTEVSLDFLTIKQTCLFSMCGWFLLCPRLGVGILAYSNIHPKQARNNTNFLKLSCQLICNSLYKISNPISDLCASRDDKRTT